MAFERIIVTGSSGSGKSTLARQMGARLELPVIHLDREFWQPGWVEPIAAEWRATCIALASRERWVMDGSYSSTWDVRLPRAQAIIWLDLPRRVYFARAVWRSVRGYGRVRPDIGPQCPEHFDPKFLFDWVWNYPTRSRPRLFERLEAARGLGKHVVVLHTPAEVRGFTAGLPKSMDAAIS